MDPFDDPMEFVRKQKELDGAILSRRPVAEVIQEWSERDEDVKQSESNSTGRSSVSVGGTSAAVGDQAD